MEILAALGKELFRFFDSLRRLCFFCIIEQIRHEMCETQNRDKGNDRFMRIITGDFKGRRLEMPVGNDIDDGEGKGSAVQHDRG